MPVQLSNHVQLWVPEELRLVVKNLWKFASDKHDLEENLQKVGSEEKRLHKIRIWLRFLQIVVETIPSLKKHELSPASKKVRILVSIIYSHFIAILLVSASMWLQ